MKNKNERDENVRMSRRRQQKQRMQKRLLIIGACLVAVLVIGGSVWGLTQFGKSNSSAKETPETTVSSTQKNEKKAKKKQSKKATKTTDSSTKSSTESSTNKESEDELQTILTTYSEKLTEQTPILIDEYQTEIQSNQNGVAGLSSIANQKALALQAISNEGISKLKAAHQADSSSTVDINSLVDQLSSKYTTEVAKISDIYLRTSSALQAEEANKQETSSSTSEETMTSTTEQTAETTSNQMTDTSETTTNQSATTVVLAGEGPNQVAQRTGVPVETILALNGMTMDDYFLTPGAVLQLQ
ncbi:peptidoglycan-binding protein LysM [Enterococcus thailandicus]|uniref:peptidoglycan-binding protein LysM n=1 Tax=Enterococcus thailandicus TaxID=417368 RepID=UPI0022EBD511|nr:peptidoglycan-binding protein LysM [Enterococcus thailandicus]MDA3972835.1 peptidoglycan-binding protein LysM [Enterococcus thailandicus]MDA3975731.1 peptidoglycan-binding protein LysM [Enterococcus thailandicus]MDA3980295.1 peptidoglycan-binding protein LysM [Enterococcus thailandicus]